MSLRTQHYNKIIFSLGWVISKLTWQKQNQFRCLFVLATRYSRPSRSGRVPGGDRTHDRKLEVRCGYQLRYRNVLLLMLKEPRNAFHFLALLSQPYIYIISQNLKNVKFSKVRIEKFGLSTLAFQTRYALPYSYNSLFGRGQITTKKITNNN